MTVADKLAYLGETKTAIRNAIQAKGVTVLPESTFRNYASKIAEISGGEEKETEYPVWIDSTWSEYLTSNNPVAPAFLTSPVAGDLLVLTLFTRKEPVSLPDGFVEVGRSPVIGSLPTFMIVYKKVADGDEETFPVLFSGTADRTCINVSQFRGTKTPEISDFSSSVIDTSSQANFQIDLGSVLNPSPLKSGTVVLGICTSLANSTSSLATTVNIPFYGWGAIHNTNGTSSSHQNRMLINLISMVAGESKKAYTPLVTLSHADGLSAFKYLICVNG